MKFVMRTISSAVLTHLALLTGAHAADVSESGRLIDQDKCYGCHAKKSGFSNGDMIYTRSDSKVNNLSKLRSMVSICNSELRLDLFPEDESDVATYLNHQFYKFKSQ